MKKIIFILVLVMFSNVKAQVYSINPSFDSLRANVLAMLNSSTSGNVSTAKVDYIINMSIGEVCDAFPAIEKVDTLSVNRSVAGHPLNNDFLRLKSLFRVDSYGDADNEQRIWMPINYVPYDSLAIVFDTKKKNAYQFSKTDTMLTAYTWNRNLYFQPLNYKPTNDPDIFIVFYYARDEVLVNGTDSTNIAPEYMEELTYYIMSWIRTLQEDYEVSDFYLNRYKASSVTPKSREVDLKK